MTESSLDGFLEQFSRSEECTVCSPRVESVSSLLVPANFGSDLQVCWERGWGEGNKSHTPARPDGSAD